MAKGKRFSSVPKSILILVYRGARKERRESGNYLSSFFVISALSVLSAVNKYRDVSIHPFSISINVSFCYSIDVNRKVFTLSAKL